MREFASAYRVMYGMGSSGLETRKQAEAFLSSLLHHPASWEVYTATLLSPTLLEDSQLSMGLVQLAAICLFQKISQDFREIESDSIRSWEIFQALLQISGKDPLVFDEKTCSLICRSLAAFLIRKRDSKAPLDEIVIPVLGSNIFASTCVLCFLPEVLSSLHSQLDDARHFELVEHFENRAKFVVDFAVKVIQSSQFSPFIVIRAFDALAYWLLYCFGKGNHEVIIETPLVSICLQGLKHKEVFEHAVDCVIAIVKATSDYNSYSRVIELILPSVLEMRLVYSEACQNEDLDLARSIARLFGAVGEHYAGFVIEILGSEFPSDNAIRLVMETLDAIVTCAAHSEPNISFSVFPFFFQMCDIMQNLQEHDSAKWLRISKRIESILIRFLSSIEFSMRFDQDYDIHSSEYEVKRSDRYDAGQALVDVATMISSEVLFDYLKIRLDSLAASPSPAWFEIEAFLYVVQWISRVLPKDGSSVLNRVFSAACSIPGNSHPLLLHSAILVLAEYSQLIGFHLDLCANLLQIINNGLSHSLTLIRSASCSCFRSLCVACCEAEIRTEVLESLFSTYSTFSRDSASSLDHQDQLLLVEGVSILAGSLEGKLSKHAFEQISVPIIQSISEIISVTPLTDVSRKSLTNLLDKFINVLKSFQWHGAGSHPAVETLTSFWSMSETIFSLLSHDAEIMESLCRAWKYAIREVRTQILFLLAPLTNRIVGLFLSHPHCSFLYLISVCVKQFARIDPQLDLLLQSFLPSLSIAVLNILKTEQE